MNTPASPAESAVRYEIFNPPGLVPLGHPQGWENGSAVRSDLNRLLDSQHLDDRAAVTVIRANFRVNDSLAVPDEFPHMDDMHRNVLEWLTWLDGPSRDRFLAWHLEREAATQQRLRGDVFDLQTVTLQGTDRLIGYGFLPSGARMAMEGILHGMTYRAWDTFGSGAWLANGLHRPGFMALAQVYENDLPGIAGMRPDIPRIHTHESLHGWHEHAKTGLDVILPSEDTGSTNWANEAVVEHLAQVSGGGDQYTVRPGERLTVQGNNLEGRDLLGTITRVGGISLELWVEAFNEPLEADRQPARQALHRQLGELSVRIAPELGGRNLAAAIGAELESATAVHRPKIMQRWIDRLAA